MCGDGLAAGGRQAEHPNSDQPASRVVVNIQPRTQQTIVIPFPGLLLAFAAFAILGCSSHPWFSVSEHTSWWWTRRKMASPMLESRIEPHKKAHFSLHISDRIRSSDDALGDFSSVKCESSLQSPCLGQLADSTLRQPQALANVGIALHNADIALIDQPIQSPHRRHEQFGRQGCLHLHRAEVATQEVVCPRLRCFEPAGHA